METYWIKEYINQHAKEVVLILGETYAKNLEDMAIELQVHPKEVIRRSLSLMNHAMNADSVSMVKNDKNYFVELGKPRKIKNLLLDLD